MCAKNDSLRKAFCALSHATAGRCVSGVYEAAENVCAAWFSFGFVKWQSLVTLRFQAIEPA